MPIKFLVLGGGGRGFFGRGGGWKCQLYSYGLGDFLELRASGAQKSEEKVRV